MQLRTGECITETHESIFVSMEASLDGIDFHLTRSSPARGAAIVIPVLEIDYDAVIFTTKARSDIRAYIFHGGYWALDVCCTIAGPQGSAVLGL